MANLPVKEATAAATRYVKTSGAGTDGDPHIQEVLETNSAAIKTAVEGTLTVDSELPAAAALTDNFANPTVPGVGGFGMVWDGATWDRMPGTSADGVTVNLGTNNDVTVTGTVTVDGSGVTQPVSGTVTANLSATDNAVLDSIDLSNKNVISTNNSTTATLANDAVYTGTGDDVSRYAAVTIQLDASHDSATNGMTFQFSTDNTNWDDVYTFTYTAADGARRFQYAVTAQYFRIVYTNGGTTQTHFRVQTILHADNVHTSVHRASDNVDPDRSATLVKSILVAQAAGSGDFIPIDATAAGNLKVALEENDAGNLTTNTVQLGGTAISMNTGVRDAGTQRVTIATDDSVPVTGTVTANLSATDNAVLDQIELNTSYGDNTGAGTETGVLRVTLPTDGTGQVKLAAGSASVGTLGANSGTDIGDVTLNNPGFQAASTDWKYADINDATSGDNTIVAAQGAGNKIAVWAILIVSDGTVDVRWEDGAAGTAFTGQVPLQAREGYAIAAGGTVPLFVGTANTLLNLELSAAINVHGFVSYTVVT